MKARFSCLATGLFAAFFSFLVLGAAVSAADNPKMPDFSWDTVPRYMHLRKA